MKPVAMFVAGAVLAATMVMLVMRPGEAPSAQAVTQTAPSPAAEFTAEVESNQPTETPEQVPAKPSPMPPQKEEPKRSAQVHQAKAAPKSPVARSTSSGQRPEPVAAKTPSPESVITSGNTGSSSSGSQSDPAPSQPQPTVAAKLPDSFPPPPPPQPQTVTIPAGTLLSVRVDQTLRSDKNQNGDSFRATLDQPLVVDGFVIAERGSKVEGRISNVDQAGRIKGVAQMTLELVRLNTSDGQRVNLQTDTFNRQGDKSVKSDAAKVGVAAGIGAAIGAIAGGGKGAAIGAGIGGAAGAGGVMATRGKAAEIPAETRLSFRLREPVTITEKL